MRILDLGAHDGFVSAFVADQLGEQITRLDGVELNSHGVAEMNRRLADRELPGQCKQGRAEDAPALFPPGTYDAVIAFELIEHVPDVDAFLEACEQMCAPGGRVYISTPDGVFGDGQNPHHLRVYRAIDLAELLRRRGILQGAVVGPDGITVTSYIPWSALTEARPHDRGEVAIYTGPGWKQWSPLNRLQPGGLGGSETAAAALAEQLQKAGYTVTVYGQVDPGVVGQVVYRDSAAFDPMTPRQAVIYSRAPHMADRPTNAKRTLLWMHDTDYGPELTEERAKRFDAILVLSRWHQEHVQRIYPFTRGRVRRVQNGITPSYFTDATPGPRVAERCLFSSSPDRGLDLLLEWWPQVRFHVPDAELLFCYADVYQAVAGVRPEVAAHHARIKELAEQPGVTNLGALSQPNLAGVMQECGVWLHPSYNSPHEVPFMETFCIGAVEAAAAGCVRVMADHGALSERSFADEPPTAFMHSSGRPLEDVWVPAIVRAIQSAQTRTLKPSKLALHHGSWGQVAFAFDRLIAA